MSMTPGIGGGLPQNIQTGAMLKAREAAERALQARRAAGGASAAGTVRKNAPAFELPPASPLRETREAGLAARPERTPLAETAPPVQNPTVQHNAGSVNINPQWERTVREVQNIAEQSGFVGLSERDIRQAYLRGESLLADYRV